MKIDANKIIGILLAAMIAMAGWYLKTVSAEICLLREDVFLARMQSYQIAVAIEIDKGGDPREIPIPSSHKKNGK